MKENLSVCPSSWDSHIAGLDDESKILLSKPLNFVIQKVVKAPAPRDTKYCALLWQAWQLEIPQWSPPKVARRYILESIKIYIVLSYAYILNLINKKLSLSPTDFST